MNEEAKKKKRKKKLGRIIPLKEVKIIPGGPSAVTSEDVGTTVFYPAGSAYWGELHEKEEAKKYYEFLSDDDVTQKTRIPYKKFDPKTRSEQGFDSKQAEIKVREYNSKKAKWETILTVANNVLRVMPTILIVALPMFILKEIANIEYSIILTVYILMIFAFIITGISHFFATKNLYAINDWINQLTKDIELNK